MSTPDSGSPDHSGDETTPSTGDPSHPEHAGGSSPSPVPHTPSSDPADDAAVTGPPPPASQPPAGEAEGSEPPPPPHEPEPEPPTPTPTPGETPDATDGALGDEHFGSDAEEHPDGPDPEAGEAEASLQADGRPQTRTPPAPPAPKAAGIIQSIEDEDAVVLLEDGRTARMRKLDLADAQGKISAVVGDRVEGGLHDEADGSLRLKKRSARAEAIGALADLFTSKIPVEGRVTHGVKGGFEVRINGLRAFCPSSQLSLRRDDLQGDPIGQTLQFVLTKWDPEGRSLVVSRRKLLEREQKKMAAGAKVRIAPGARLTGRVVGFQPYGAFVDLGGIQGLLHVSEMSHARVQDPRALVSIGDEIEVIVLKHDETFKKVSLSRKALEQDPWGLHADSLKAGRVVNATCKRVASVGAFCEIFPGLEGLLPASVDSMGEEGQSDLPEAGADVLLRLVDVDPRRQHPQAQARA